VTSSKRGLCGEGCKDGVVLLVSYDAVLNERFEFLKISTLAWGRNLKGQVRLEKVERIRADKHS